MDRQDSLPCRAVAESVEAVEDLRAADGRVPGRRGRATRQRLLECTAEMLRTTSYRVGEGHRHRPRGRHVAGDLLPVLRRRRGGHPRARPGDGARRPSAWSGSWPRAPGRARPATGPPSTLTDAFFDFWDQHRPVLRVVDLTTEEGDRRFRNIRVRLLNAVTTELARRRQPLPGRGQEPRASSRWPRPGRWSPRWPTWPPTTTASSSGASAPPTSGSRWPARSTGAPPASDRPPGVSEGERTMSTVLYSARRADRSLRASRRVRR